MNTLPQYNFQTLVKSLLGYIVVILFCSINISHDCYANTISIKRIVILGDSLSDTGNDYQASYGIHSIIKSIPSMAKDFPLGYIPSGFNAPYFDGRFSDGKVWIEDLANLFHITDTSLHHHGALDNYAFGGAWSNYSHDGPISKLDIFPPDLAGQVALYKLGHLIATDKNQTLIVIMAGANDYLSVTNNSQEQQKINAMITGIINAINKMSQYGYHHFLVAGLPDLGLTPYATENHDTSIPGLLTDFSSQSNESLKKAINTYVTLHPNNNIIYWDWLQLHREIYNHYQIYHFKTNSKPCHDLDPYHKPLGMLKNNIDLLITAQSSNKKTDLAQCQKINDQVDPSWEYLYIDDVHPTELAHCMLALSACLKLKDAGYQWLDNKGVSQVLNCGISSQKTDLKKAADICYNNLKQGTLQADVLIKPDDTPT